jgi:hypothetical protein
MDKLQPGHDWKTPFYRGPGCPFPPAGRRPGFEPVNDNALRAAISAVMEAGTDASDEHTVSRTGSDNLGRVSSFSRAGYIERAPWQRPLR